MEEALANGAAAESVEAEIFEFKDNEVV